MQFTTTNNLHRVGQCPPYTTPSRPATSDHLWYVISDRAARPDSGVIVFPNLDPGRGQPARPSLQPFPACKVRRSGDTKCCGRDPRRAVPSSRTRQQEMVQIWRGVAEPPGGRARPNHARTRALTHSLYLLDDKHLLLLLGRCFRSYMMHDQVPKFAKIHSHMYNHGNLGGSCGNRPGLMPTALLFVLSQATTTLSHRPFPASPQTVVTRPPG